MEHPAAVNKTISASPSTRRAWIEIARPQTGAASFYGVALHPEGVDRNIATLGTTLSAPRSPSTRRAWIEIQTRLLTTRSKKSVALHPEGVDRNVYQRFIRLALFGGSPSTRRAWIEIKGVDLSEHQGTSPSTRRAWIEIFAVGVRPAFSIVALHPEGVDRNRSLYTAARVRGRRPPPGGRG